MYFQCLKVGTVEARRVMVIETGSVISNDLGRSVHKLR